ncbi:MAG TPA: PTS sugar transporter subunit IIA [Candidatus Hydrogenedentes bacterium]|nr:PTS sugar transporter subunit IIA [Candidatus Hydrogenedentota bacterium]HNT88545.1 PTS sugar transporter subunit IIA [Candidatus Hydrogenedentota bacterium]
MQAVAERFSTFLQEENIRCQLEARTGSEAIAELAYLLHANDDGFDCEAVIGACMDRERAGSTIIMPGLALPHARIADLDRLAVAVGTSEAGVYFNGSAESVAHIVVLILTPVSAPAQHLQALAALMQPLNHPDAVREVAAMTDPADVCAYFSGVDEVLPPYLEARNIMDRDVPTVRESDDLESIIGKFCSKGVLDLPVVDEEGDLRGTVALEDILKVALPEHLLWMEDLTPIIHFEPFGDMLRKGKESNVSDIMRDKCVTVGPRVPAMLLAKMFLTHQARQILVVEGRKFLGAVNLNASMSKIIWA